MIHIVKRGTDPKEEVFPATCDACRTQVTYQRADLTYDQRESGAWIHCPVCKNAIYHTERRR